MLMQGNVDMEGIGTMNLRSPLGFQEAAGMELILSKGVSMNYVTQLPNGISELTIEEIDSVSGGVIFIAPVAVKMIAWAGGAVFGLGMVAVASKIL